MMHHLTIVAQNRSGLLVELSALLASNGINIADIEGKAHGADAIIQIDVDRHEDALRVLAEEQFHVVADDSLLVRIPDQPGELANIAKRLADEKIDISAIRVVQRHANFSVISVNCDKNDAARAVLQDVLLR
jgi:hypothetical protein